MKGAKNRMFFDEGLRIKYRPNFFQRNKTSWTRVRVGDEKIIREVLVRKEYCKCGIDVVGGSWLDIGAHVGTFACMAAQKGARVLACEPHPESRKLLRQNINDNSLKVSVLSQALGINKAIDNIKTVKLYLAAESHAMHSTSREPARDNGYVLVKKADVRSILRKHVWIDSMKVDCEGEEKPILTKLLSSKKYIQRLRQIVFEWDLKPERKGDFPKTAPLKGILGKLRRAGYLVKTSSNWKRHKHQKYWTRRHTKSGRRIVLWPSGVLVYAVEKRRMQ